MHIAQFLQFADWLQSERAYHLFYLSALYDYFSSCPCQHLATSLTSLSMLFIVASSLPGTFVCCMRICVIISLTPSIFTVPSQNLHLVMLIYIFVGRYKPTLR